MLNVLPHQRSFSFSAKVSVLQSMYTLTNILTEDNFKNLLHIFLTSIYLHGQSVNVPVAGPSLIACNLMTGSMLFTPIYVALARTHS